MVFMSVQDAVDLIRLEYAEIPGLQLTLCQAQRLWNLSDELCARALGALIRSGYLVRTPDGCYARPAIERRARLSLRRAP
jgi:hypothetical protein